VGQNHDDHGQTAEPVQILSSPALRHLWHAHGYATAIAASAIPLIDGCVLGMGPVRAG